MHGGMVMELTLDQLRPGMEAVVLRLTLGEELRLRLQDFGLVPGTRVGCRCRSAKGELIALELRGTVVALRRGALRGILGKRVA